MAQFYDEHGRWQSVPGLNLETLPVDEQLAYRMGEAAAVAASQAASLGETLDYTADSLLMLDKILARIHSEIPRGLGAWLTGKSMSIERIHELGLPWGAYLGEVLRLNDGFKWVAKHPLEAAGIGNYMRSSDLTIAPVDKVWNRLTTDSRGDMVAFHKMVLERGDQTDLLIIRDEDLDV